MGWGKGLEGNIVQLDFSGDEGSLRLEGRTRPLPRGDSRGSHGSGVLEPPADPRSLRGEPE